MRSLYLLLLLGAISMAFSQNQPTYYNIKDFGASGNKEEKATQALQSAIDACHAGGGGVVYLPPGDYTSGTVILRSYCRLFLEAGATLYASQDTADYPFLTSAKRPCLIYADSAKFISIEGKGRIHGQARRVYEDLKGVDRFIEDITENAREAGVEMKMYYKVPPLLRMITFENCQDVWLEDISILESCSWNVTIKWCERVVVKGIYIYSDLDAGVNSDGLDIDLCRNVTISDCIVITGDDAIVLKANYAKHKLDWACENITITNCIVSSTSTGLKIGTESYHDFRHIIFSNCVVRNSNRGLSIVVRDGAIVEDILFSNITIECNRKHFNWWGNGDPIWLVIRDRYPTRDWPALGKIRNVVFENIIAHGQGTSMLEGFAPDSLHPEGSRLENIQLRNVQLFMEKEDYADKRANHALAAHDIDNISVENLTVLWDRDSVEAGWQSAMYLKDIDGLELNHIKARQGLVDSNHAVIHLDQVQQALIQELIALPGSHTLLKVEGEKSHEILYRDLDPFGRANHILDLPTNAALRNIRKWE